VSLNKALAQGFQLVALRAVGAAFISGGVPYFSAARLSPQLLDPAAARRDVARLRRDRRDARPEHDAVRVALVHDASLRPWSEGAHVEAVARALLSPQQVCAVLRTALGASHLLDSSRRRPPPPGCLFRRAKHADGCVHSRPHRF